MPWGKPGTPGLGTPVTWSVGSIQSAQEETLVELVVPVTVLEAEEVMLPVVVLAVVVESDAVFVVVDVVVVVVSEVVGPCVVVVPLPK